MDDFSYYNDRGQLVRVRVVPTGEQRCASCRHFDPHGSNEGGNCWRYPPTIVPMILPNVGEFTQAEQMRPWVSAKDTCGEWRGRDHGQEGTDAGPGGAADS